MPVPELAMVGLFVTIRQNSASASASFFDVNVSQYRCI